MQKILVGLMLAGAISVGDSAARAADVAAGKAKAT